MEEEMDILYDAVKKGDYLTVKEILQQGVIFEVYTEVLLWSLHYSQFNITKYIVEEFPNVNINRALLSSNDHEILDYLISQVQMKVY